MFHSLPTLPEPLKMRGKPLGIPCAAEALAESVATRRGEKAMVKNSPRRQGESSMRSGADRRKAWMASNDSKSRCLRCLGPGFRPAALATDQSYVQRQLAKAMGIHMVLDVGWQASGGQG